MLADSITLVQQSFAKVEPIAPQAAALFYQNLFDLDPTVQALFKGDMVQQGQRLMQMIALAVSKLNEPAALIPVLQHLAVRHKDYGVRDEHYATVGAALLRTLEQGLGDAWTPQVRQAWVEAYELIANTMVKAAHRS